MKRDTRTNTKRASKEGCKPNLCREINQSCRIKRVERGSWAREEGEFVPRERSAGRKDGLAHGAHTPGWNRLFPRELTTTKLRNGVVKCSGGARILRKGFVLGGVIEVADCVRLDRKCLPLTLRSRQVIGQSRYFAKNNDTFPWHILTSFNVLQRKIVVLRM